MTPHRSVATKAERMLAAVEHREPDVVPGNEFFMDDDAERAYCEHVDLTRTGGWAADAIALAELTDNHTISAGGGGLRSRVIERGSDYEVLEYENGMKWRIHHNPYWREYFDYPIQSEADVVKVALPDPDDPSRYSELAERAEFLRQRGYFVGGGTTGVFSALWYFWVKFDTVLEWMVIKPDLLHDLLDKVAGYSVRAAARVAEQGVHSVGWVDDLGYNRGTFFSPRHYLEFIHPWHQRIAKACHERGVYAHMHSHGDVNVLLPYFISGGIDLLNPIGPSDNMMLGELKARYGDQITLVGGISKHIGRMTRAQLEEHVEEVIRTGAPGGGFVVYSEGGIPRDMSHEDVAFYLEMHRRYRIRYGAAGGLTEI